MHRLTPQRRWQLVLTFLVSAALIMVFGAGLDRAATHPTLIAAALLLFAVNTIWLSGTAMTALLGMRADDGAVAQTVPPEGAGPCAVLWLVCGEDPAPLAAQIDAFAQDLSRTGQDHACHIFVLSDTQGDAMLAREAVALQRVAQHITYRNRAVAAGRKPGNLRDWLHTHGARYDTMLVLDADSGFSAGRLADMRQQMAADPRLGLLQAAIRLRPGATRFARLQRLSSRLCGPVFAQGVARLSGDAGNYWGHNALIRTAAFTEVSDLAPLSGPPPFGGPVLSHDFIEAAHLRRAGWAVKIAPESRGSFESAPATIGAHLRRDRRWAQGNLQHLRLIGAPGLHPASRLHLLAGIQSYLSAPIWLALVLLFGTGAVHVTAGALWALVATLALLAVPKLAGVAAIGRRGRTPYRRSVIWRSCGAELWLSTLLAPISMIRRTSFVVAILAGRDSGWVPAGAVTARTPAAPGRAEVVWALALIVAVSVPRALIGADQAGGLSGSWAAVLMVSPILVPLLAAPWLIRWFDGTVRVPSRDRVAAYYDASTRRFLRLGGSGAALAIHRPLWAPGISDPEQAAAHVNILVRHAAEGALGRTPERVRDLGCGVGGTLLHLAGQWPRAELTGLTLSAEQAELAASHAQARGYGERILVLRSDFSLPTTLPRADLVVAIESHVHAGSADAFLRSAQSHLAPGGVLIIIDDMLTVPASALDRRGVRLVSAFRRGWRLGHVTPAQGLVDTAQGLGYRLVDQSDLSPLLRLNRWRDHALRLVGPVADATGLIRFALFANMVGGNALTQAHRAGIMSYRLIVLRTDPDGAEAVDAGATGPEKSAA